MKMKTAFTRACSREKVRPEVESFVEKSRDVGVGNLQGMWGEKRSY